MKRLVAAGVVGLGLFASSLAQAQGKKDVTWCAPVMGSSYYWDVLSAVELGYMHARGHPVFGYTNVTLDYEARVSDESMAVEAFQFVDNLMCEGPIWRSGGSVVRTHVDPGDLYTDLRGFTRCVEQAATLLGVAPPR